MSGYTPAGNFAPTVQGPAGADGVDGDSMPEGLAVAFDFEREELLALDDAFITPRLDDWDAAAGATVTYSTEEGRGVYDLTLTGTVGGNWISSQPLNLAAGPRSFELVAGPAVTGWLLMEVATGAGVLRSWYNVSTGVLGGATVDARIIDRQIERVEPATSRPFWRCRLTVDATVGAPECRAYAVDGDGSTVGIVDAADPSLVFLAQYQNDPTFPDRFGPATRLIQRRIERVDCVGWRRFVHGFQGDPSRQPLYFNRDSCEWGGYGYGSGGVNAPDVGAYFGGASSNVDGSRWLEIIGAAGVVELVRRLSDLALPWTAYLAARPRDLVTAAARPLFGLYTALTTDRAELIYFLADRCHYGGIACNVTAREDRQLFVAQYQGQDRRLARLPLLGAPDIDADLISTLEPQPAAQLTRACLGGTPTGTDHPAIASDATIWGFYLGIDQHTAAPIAWIAPRHGVTP